MAVVTIDDMQDKLLTLDEVRARLAATEPLDQLTFPVASTTKFSVGPGWADVPDDEPTDAYLTTPAGTRYQLTRKALLEAGAACGIPRGYQLRLPAQHLTPQLDYWFRDGFGDKEFKLLSQDRPDAPPLARAMCRGTITPFSNLRLLDIAEERIQGKYGSSAKILADYKFGHDLELTSLRLIVPEHSRTITGSRVESDLWSAGLDMRNSLIGLKPTDISGYLFRYWCTNGCTDTLLSSGQFSRRGNHDEDDVWMWAQQAVDSVLGGLEASFDAIQVLTTIPVSGDVTLVLRDLFGQYNIPVGERQRIIDAMADMGGDITLYDIQQAITNAANLYGLASRTVERLLAMGGHIAHAATARCDSCRRLMPDGWTPQALPAAAPAE
jgi:hypothetical protein